MPPGKPGHGKRPPMGKPPIKKGGKKDAKPKNVPVSKRIRDVKRLLNKPDLDAAVRAAQEKKLAALEEELEGRKVVARERKYAVRYHKIRFFERVKLERRLGQLRRLCDAAAAGKGPPLTSEEEAEMEQVTEDLEYVKNFPKGEKYTSIIKNADTPEAQAHLEAERARLRALVKQQLAEAALVTEADEGRSLAARAAGKATKAGSAVAGSKAAAAASSDDEAGSEGEEKEQDDFFLAESDEEGPAAPGRAAAAAASDEDAGLEGASSSEEEGSEDESMGGSESEDEAGEEDSGEEPDIGGGEEYGAGPSSSEGEEEGSSSDDDEPRQDGFKGGDRQRAGRGERGRSGGRGGGRGPGRGGGRFGGGRGGGRGFSGGVEKRSGPPAPKPSKPPQQPQKPPPKAEEKTPQRKRAEGGRKRRKKK